MPLLLVAALLAASVGAGCVIPSFTPIIDPPPLMVNLSPSGTLTDLFGPGLRLDVEVIAALQPGEHVAYGIIHTDNLATADAVEFQAPRPSETADPSEGASSGRMSDSRSATFVADAPDTFRLRAWAAILVGDSLVRRDYASATLSLRGDESHVESARFAAFPDESPEDYRVPPLWATEEFELSIVGADAGHSSLLAIMDAGPQSPIDMTLKANWRVDGIETSDEFNLFKTTAQDLTVPLNGVDYRSAQNVSLSVTLYPHPRLGFGPFSDAIALVREGDSFAPAPLPAASLPREREHAPSAATE